MLTVKEASEVLGVSVTSIYNTKYMKKHCIKASKGQYNARFDLNGYQREQEYMDRIVKQTQLLVEYITKETLKSYKWIVEVSGVNYNSIFYHKFSFDSALRIIRGISRADRQLLC